jgi:choline monooxygenase
MDYLDEATYRSTRFPTELATTLLPAAYHDADFHDLEREHLWRTSWVAVGYTEEVNRPGNAIVREVAGRSVVILRDREGELRAFLNVCRHRAAQLVARDCELGKRIRCPYHAWAYGLDGECLGTPLFEGSDIPLDQRDMFDMSHVKEFDRADYGLLPVGVAAWGFLLFVCLDDTTPPLSEWLGDLPDRLDGYRFEQWRAQAKKDYRVAANWKLIAENFMEYYHLPWVHPELMKVSRMQDHYRFQGPGMYTGMTTNPVSRDENSVWVDLPPCEGLPEEHLAAGRFMLLFPNVALSVLPNHAFVIMLQPAGPDTTVERTVLLTHPDAMSQPESTDALAKLHAFWDHVNLEDVEIVERVQAGISIPEYPGGRMCYRFEEPLHRFQNMVIDRMVGVERIPDGDSTEGARVFD